MTHSQSTTDYERFRDCLLTRYAVASVCLYGAFYFALLDTRRDGGFTTMCAFTAAALAAREIALWMAALLVVFLMWGVFSGIASTRESATVAVAVLIIVWAVTKLQGIEDAYRPGPTKPRP